MRRKAQTSCTSSRSVMCVSGWNSPAHGRSRGKRNRELRLPTIAQQIIGMRRDARGFHAPIAQTIQRADAEPTKTRRVSALGCFETPIEIALRSRRCASRRRCRGRRFPGRRRDLRRRPATSGRYSSVSIGPTSSETLGISSCNARDAVGEVTVGNKFRMFARDEQNIAKALLLQRPGFAAELHPRKG